MGFAVTYGSPLINVIGEMFGLLWVYDFFCLFFILLMESI